MALDRTWYNTLTDDSGSGTDGSVWGKADVDALMDAIDVSVKPFLQWTMRQGEAPGANAAAEGTRNNRKTYDFDGATDEEMVFPGVLPLQYGGSGVTVECYAITASATSGSFRWQAAIERFGTDAIDADSDAFEAFQSAGGTAPASSGLLTKVSIAFTNGAQMASVAAGECFRLKIRRDADGTSGTDDIATDIQLLYLVLRET